MVAEPLSVHPEILNRQANDLLDAMDASAKDHARHHDAIAESASGWVGESARALENLRVTWEDQRNVLHKELGAQGIHMQEVAGGIADMDGTNGARIDKSGQ
ncbi:hypothetical protein HNP40_001004 [Mycobacteroides chelonae]|nr:hypothetical protein [Mycobacteroides chelonae]